MAGEEGRRRCDERHSFGCDGAFIHRDKALVRPFVVDEAFHPLLGAAAPVGQYRVCLSQALGPFFGLRVLCLASCILCSFWMVSERRCAPSLLLCCAVLWVFRYDASRVFHHLFFVSFVFFRSMFCLSIAVLCVFRCLTCVCLPPFLSIPSLSRAPSVQNLTCVLNAYHHLCLSFSSCFFQSTFCLFEEHYFDTPQALAKHYKDDFGFTPSETRLEDIDQAVLRSLTDQVCSGELV